MPTLSFTCPICGADVQMEETGQHNIKQLSEPHMPPPVWKNEIPDDDCAVHFSRQDRHILHKYDFIKYEIPFIFTQIPADITDTQILESAINGLQDEELGLSVKVDLENNQTGFVHAWYHSNQPAYYAVTDGINTPQNVLVSGNEDELYDFLERWFLKNTDSE
jgi:hypothetical protein